VERAPAGHVPGPASGTVIVSHRDRGCIDSHGARGGGKPRLLYSRRHWGAQGCGWLWGMLRSRSAATVVEWWVNPEDRKSNEGFVGVYVEMVIVDLENGSRGY
jgi:hypothetical protein